MVVAAVYLINSARDSHVVTKHVIIVQYAVVLQQSNLFTTHMNNTPCSYCATTKPERLWLRCFAPRCTAWICPQCIHHFQSENWMIDGKCYCAAHTQQYSYEPK